MCSCALFGTISRLRAFRLRTSVAVAGARGWEPVLQPWLPFVAPIVGVVVGLVSGAYSALRAAAIEPVDALRSN